MDSGNCQTSTASPADPGGLLRCARGGTKPRAAQQLVEKAQRLEKNRHEGHLAKAEKAFAELDGEMDSLTEFLRALELQPRKKPKRNPGGAGLETEGGSSDEEHLDSRG